MEIIHKDMRVEDGIHVIHSFEVNSLDELETLELTLEDVNKIVLNKATNQFIKIDSVSPIVTSSIAGDDKVKQDELDILLEKKVDIVVGKQLSDENFTAEMKEAVLNIPPIHFKGLFSSVESLELAFPVGKEGDYAHVDLGVGEDVASYIFDLSDSKWVKQKGISASLTAPEVRTLFLANLGTEELTTELKDKLDKIEDEANKTVVTQTTGTSVEEVMSQASTTEELDKKIDKESIVDDYGILEDKVLSQAAVTEKFAKRGMGGKGLLLADLNDITTDSGMYICNLTTAGTFPYPDFPKLGTTVAIIKYNDTYTSQVMYKYTDTSRMWLRTAREDAWLDVWSEVLTEGLLVQEGGESETLVMSQKAVTDMVNAAVISGGGSPSTATTVSFNNTVNGFTATTVQKAIEEVLAAIPETYSAEKINETSLKQFVSVEQKSQIDLAALEISSQAQRIAILEANPSTSSDNDKVKLTSEGTSGFLIDKLDLSLFSIKNDKVLVDKLNNLEATIDELNYLRGASRNIQAQINDLTSINSIVGTTNTFSSLDVDFGSVEEGDMVIVLADETRGGISTIYLKSFSGWVFAGNFSSSDRDFITNPIALENNTSGILPKTAYEKQTASETTITNSNNLFTSANVEDALNELFTLANSFKSSVITSIGSPLNINDTREQVLLKVTQLKNILATAITEKGVPAYAYNTLNELANKISVIPNVVLDGGVKTTESIDVESIPFTHEITLLEPVSLEQTTTNAFEYLEGEFDKAIYTTTYPENDQALFIYDSNNINFRNHLSIKNFELYSLENTNDFNYVSEEIDFNLCTNFSEIEFTSSLLELKIYKLPCDGFNVLYNFDIPLKNITRLSSLYLDTNFIGTSIFKTVLSFNGGTSWLSYNGTSWIEVNINDPLDFSTNGMNSSFINDLDIEVINTELGTSNYIRFAHYIKQTVATDLVSHKALVLKGDIDGRYDLLSTSNYSYSYNAAEKKISYIFNKLGKFKINYVDGN